MQFALIGRRALKDGKGGGCLVFYRTNIFDADCVSRTLLSDGNVTRVHIVRATVALAYPMGSGNMLAKESDVVAYVD